MKEAPCKFCILVPRCRLKHFVELVEECYIVSDYLFVNILPKTDKQYNPITEIIEKRRKYAKLLEKVYKALNPKPLWGYKMEQTKTHMTLVDATSHTTSFYLVKNPNNQIGERFTLRSALRNKWYDPK